MTEQTSPAHPKAHAAAGQPAGQPAGQAAAQSLHAPSPLDIAARAAHRDAAAAPSHAVATHAVATHTAPSQVAVPGTSAAAQDKHDKKAKARVTGAQALVLALENVGVDVVFGIPGGAVLP